MAKSNKTRQPKRSKKPEKPAKQPKRPDEQAKSKGRANGNGPRNNQLDKVDEASWESFPASDPPGY